ncbi:response regulator [Confluentibacter flavum]|uniref:Response regulator n=1 Tax=Confluentibacter flavum TaxID=1909700 RepID=A0A2N3HJI8_9FLAO|nr:response regulator [Confluentibacter flavum]PKQ45139.1 response regulator [Confluentibacter flavum]
MLLKPLLIYLADDDKEDRMLFKEALDDLDMNVSIEDFDNGVTLMVNLLDLDKPLPDVIYLDLNMPLMNGEECLNDIRSEPRLSNIPIIIYSTYADKSISDELQKKGANLYLVKPNSFKMLKNLLSRSLEYIHLSRDTTDFSEFVISEKKSKVRS